MHRESRPCPKAELARNPQQEHRWKGSNLETHTGINEERFLAEEGFFLFVLNKGTKTQEPPESSVFVTYFNLTFPCDHPGIKALEASRFPGAHNSPKFSLKHKM